MTCSEGVSARDQRVAYASHHLVLAPSGRPQEASGRAAGEHGDCWSGFQSAPETPTMCAQQALGFCCNCVKPVPPNKALHSPGAASPAVWPLACELYGEGRGGKQSQAEWSRAEQPSPCHPCCLVWECGPGKVAGSEALPINSNCS